MNRTRTPSRSGPSRPSRGRRSLLGLLGLLLELLLLCCELGLVRLCRTLLVLIFRHPSTIHQRPVVAGSARPTAAVHEVRRREVPSVRRGVEWLLPRPPVCRRSEVIVPIIAWDLGAQRRIHPGTVVAGLATIIAALPRRLELGRPGAWLRIAAWGCSHLRGLRGRCRAGAWPRQRGRCRASGPRSAGRRPRGAPARSRRGRRAASA